MRRFGSKWAGDTERSPLVSVTTLDPVTTDIYPVAAPIPVLGGARCSQSAEINRKGVCDE